jgi:hypothetical protein
MAIPASRGRRHSGLREIALMISAGGKGKAKVESATGSVMQW